MGPGCRFSLNRPARSLLFPGFDYVYIYIYTYIMFISHRPDSCLILFDS